MIRKRIRIVLDDEVSEDNLVPLIARHHWLIKERIQKKGDRPLEFIYGTNDLANDIHYIVDHKIGVKYLLVTGPQAPQLEEMLRENLYQWASIAIIERARESNLSPADRRQALYHLAVDKMDHGFDQETFEIFSKAMKDPDPFVRASAVLGASYLAWPQLVEAMRPLATDAEPDTAVRKSAAAVVAKLGTKGA